MHEIKRILYFPVKVIRWALDLDRRIEIIPDNCPPGFDFTEAGRIPVEKIEISIKVMKKINRVGEYKP